MEALLRFSLATSHILKRQCIAGAAFGLLSHILYFVRGYHDTQALGIFAGHIMMYTALAAPLVAKKGVYAGGLTASAIFASYLVALFTSIGVYRVFFHRLSRFPGPLAAKLTKIYGPYTARNGQMHIEQNKLFEKYGDIIRIGPNELLILSTDAIPKIHSAKSGCRKRDAGIYNIVTYKGEYNLDSILDREEHRWRRQVWERAMTTKGIHSYENSTRMVCKTFLGKVAALEGRPIDSSLFSLLITFDNMGKIGFSHQFGTIEAGKENHMLGLLEVTFGQIAQLGELVWPLAFFKSLGVGGDSAKFDALTRKMADTRREAQTEEIPDIFGHFVADFDSQKPTAFFNKSILYSDAGLILIGATDTIAVVLSYAFYYLAKNQSYQDRLYEEVTSAFGNTVPGEFTNNDLSKIQYLEAVINETLRLENPVCNNGARLTPLEGIVVNGVWIPGGSAVRVPGYAMQRSAKAFVQPDEFIPERWTTRPELILDSAAFFPFITGPNNCVGKRLAMMVLRLVLAYTVYDFRFEFARGEDGTAIHTKAKNNLILKAGPLNLVFTKRV
ncbi:cytochrome P450 [Lasiosphaeria hispida]|uniref:Cytochrome P450 n=1 Tax=Lasiosphaeria hispida TaxID=260671 RepID=A0AAJ0HKW4_9PEZI|nr:cytochrome P450 [Lasiosphaeria hispida]